MDTVRPEVNAAPLALPTNLEPDAISTTVAELKTMLTSQLGVPVEVQQIDGFVPLLEGGLGLDSIMLFEFIALIEKTYRFTFSEDSLHSGVFGCLNSLAEHINKIRDRA